MKCSAERPVASDCNAETASTFRPGKKLSNAGTGDGASPRASCLIRIYRDRWPDIAHADAANPPTRLHSQAVLAVRRRIRKDARIAAARRATSGRQMYARIAANR